MRCASTVNNCTANGVITYKIILITQIANVSTLLQSIKNALKYPFVEEYVVFVLFIFALCRMEF